MRPLTISYPDGDERDIAAPDDVRAFAEELSRMGNHSIPDAIFSARGLAVLRVADDNVRQIARALDHLRNAEAARTTREARDALLMRLRPSPLGYRMRSWQFEGGEASAPFVSYTGTYEVGDRLVAAKDDEFHIIEVPLQATPAEDGVLVVERWRPDEHDPRRS